MGLGFPSDFPTWGRLLYGDDFINLTPIRVVGPGVLVPVTVISVIFIGDGLWDAQTSSSVAVEPGRRTVRGSYRWLKWTRLGT